MAISMRRSSYGILGSISVASRSSMRSAQLEEGSSCVLEYQVLRKRERGVDTE